jgi:hypothetical protein
VQSDLELLGARELDARTGDGIDVRLLWQETNNRVYVHAADARTGEQFVVAVDRADALDAFRHPFAYASAAARRSRTQAPLRGAARSSLMTSE